MPAGAGHGDGNGADRRETGGDGEGLPDAGTGAGIGSADFERDGMLRLSVRQFVLDHGFESVSARRELSREIEAVRAKRSRTGFRVV